MLESMSAMLVPACRKFGGQQRSSRRRLAHLCFLVLVFLSVSTITLAQVCQPPEAREESQKLITHRKHPQIAIPHLMPTVHTKKDLQILYKKDPKADWPEDLYEENYEIDSDLLIHIQGVPQYFSDLADKHVEIEVDYWVKHGHWSTRVILEKLYFGLVWGKSGFPDHYYLTSKDTAPKNRGTKPKLEKATGWDIFLPRGNEASVEIDDGEDSLSVISSPVSTISSTSYCSWAGITCHDNKVTEIRLDSYELTGTVTPDLQYLTDLTFLDLKRESRA